jgi:hypothetical protein
MARIVTGLGLPLAALLAATAAMAQSSPVRPLSAGRTSILVLGTFHFQDAGLDEYKPRFRVDVMSAERQRELAELLSLLSRFQPTKIAVEWREERQAALDSAYQAYRTESRPLAAHEIHQIGFRLAGSLGHDRLYAIDAAARWYDLAMNTDTLVARARRFGQDDLLRRGQAWDAYYQQRYTGEDSIKTVMSLRNYLLRINSAEALRESHGAYLNGTVEVGGRGDYSGADMRSAWYNRNLRMFTNLLRMQSDREERILLIVGAGHAPLLRHFIENAPELRLVLPETWLR